MIQRAIAIIILSLFPISQTQAATLVMSGTLKPGSAILLKVTDVIPGSQLDGFLNDRPFPITPEGLAMVALDMDAPEGERTLKVIVAPPGGRTSMLVETLKISKRNYKEEHIDLPPGKVDLNTMDMTRANQENAAIRSTYGLLEGRVGFMDGFQMPITGRFSGVFGSRRVLNGKPKRPHNGVDIAAPQGTPVIAIASGTIVLTGKDYFFTGNTLVMHHGHGTLSIFAHLNDMVVQEGDWVPAGTLLGHVGMTGRATGPHLHWGMLVRGNRVDPLLMPGIRGQDDGS